MLVALTELIKHFGLVVVVRIPIFHFMKSCMLLDGGMNIKGAIKLNISRSVLVNKQLFILFIQIWPERCSMTGSSFDVNFGMVGSKFGQWGVDGTPYDFSSIMHYSTTSCAKDRSKPVITKPDGSTLTLSKGDSLSEQDIAAINMVYKCKGAPPPTTTTTTTSTTTTTTTTTTTEPDQSISVRGGNMDLTAVSRNNRIYTFTPNTELLNIETLATRNVF